MPVSLDSARLRQQMLASPGPWSNPGAMLGDPAAAGAPQIQQPGAPAAPVNFGPPQNPLTAAGGVTPLNQAVAQALVTSGMGAPPLPPPTAPPPQTRTVVAQAPTRYGVGVNGQYMEMPGQGAPSAAQVPMEAQDVAKWMQTNRDNQQIAQGKLPSMERYLGDQTKGTMSPLEQAMKLQAGAPLGDSMRQQYQDAAKQQLLAGNEQDKNAVERLRIGAGLTDTQIRTDAEKNKGLDSLIQGSVGGGDSPEVTQAKIDKYQGALKYGQNDKRALSGDGLVSPPQPGVRPSGAAPGVQAPLASAATGKPQITPEDLAKNADDVLQKAPTQEQYNAVLQAGFPGATFDPRSGQMTVAKDFDPDAMLNALAGSENVRTRGAKDLLNRLVNMPGVGGQDALRSKLEESLIGAHRDLSDNGAASTFGNIRVRPETGSLGFLKGWAVEPTSSLGQGRYVPRGFTMPGDITPTIRQSALTQKRGKAEAAASLLNAMLTGQ